VIRTNRLQGVYAVAALVAMLRWWMS